MENTKEQTVVAEATQEKTYAWGLDLIRVIAMFFVVLVHATTIYDYMGAQDVPTFVAGLSRYLSYTCIPLFILLTGYLQANKKPTLDYYLKIIRILIEYTIIGIVFTIIGWCCFDSQASIWDVLGSIALFKYPGYSWYINMYIGLFMFAPFFNMLYGALEGKNKWIFMVCLVVLFSCPQVSSYWGSAYPIMYYFIGLFLRDKQYDCNKWILLGVVVVGCFWQMLMCVVPLYGVESHNNIGCLILSVAIFMLFYKSSISESAKGKMRAAKVLRTVANASMGTFLISEVFETCTEIYFEQLGLTTFSEKLPYLTYLTPIKFIFSVVIGIAISILATGLYRLVMCVINKIRYRQKSPESKNAT